MFWKISHVHLERGHLYFRCVWTLVFFQPCVISEISGSYSGNVVALLSLLQFCHIYIWDQPRNCKNFCTDLWGCFSINPPSMHLHPREGPKQQGRSWLPVPVFFIQKDSCDLKSLSHSYFLFHDCVKNALLNKAWINMGNHWLCSSSSFASLIVDLPVVIHIL